MRGSTLLSTTYRMGCHRIRPSYTNSIRYQSTIPVGPPPPPSFDTNYSHHESSSHTRPPPDLNIFLNAASDSNPDDVPSRILAAALLQVPEHGFTTRALETGAKSLGLPSVAHGIFSRGGIDLISYFFKTSKESMRADLMAMDLASMKITPKVRAGVVSRLEKSKPFIHKWPEAAAQLALPQNLDVALKGLGELVDEIWFLAGDRSVDASMNWYSKRALLAGVYTSTEMYMTQDKSPEYQETYAFLDRRLGDVAFVGKTIAQTKQRADFLFKSAGNILESRGFRRP
ncbi:hypothetical protein SmJEL517_g02684 [Synchytrium microbalum]|uniref:Ubiquinone biosynthesis protein n=1 Tax=Synchytrium microbalum TaxID=1806994 RepID=A0A507C0N7_9FUNG|nr:uncharacterized protein SmJEL517_g02684 [Synchytrium microbalum]TPX34647.1 hypothetical protein SmJEL517_g02684 [Synchytrium microbalum]